MYCEIPIEKLIEMAQKASKNAYCPYSSFSVGAAILTKNGNIYTGCNVEFADYLALHAEVNALGTAVLNGETEIQAVCVFSYCTPPVKPCGSCRQKFAEFAKNNKHDILIIAANNEGIVEKYWLSELLPYSEIFLSLSKKCEK